MMVMKINDFCEKFDRLALFPARTIIRDSHHFKSSTFELALNHSLGSAEWSYAVVITTTPLPHNYLFCHHLHAVCISALYSFKHVPR